MTKIKNTKKGMAKKTLSISLAVAMLATSNVPVWAAEDLFTDGEVAVEVEAPVVEETVDVPEVQAIGDSWTVKLTNMPTEVEWGTDDKEVTIDVKDVAADVNKTPLKYFWKNEATGLGVTEPATIVTTATTKIPATTSKDVNASYVLYIYDDVNGGWEYTSAPVVIGKKDITDAYAITVNDRDYTGKETAKDAIVNSDIDFDIDYTGDLVNVGTVDVTATPVDTTLYKGVVRTSFKINPIDVAKADVTASMLTKEVAYTGDTIKLGKADVAVVDTNTGAGLDNLVTNVTTTAKNVADKNTANVTLEVADDKGNFVKGSTATVATEDTFKVVARDLSDVKVKFTSAGKKPDGTAYTVKDFTEYNVNFTDAEGNALYLFDDVDVIVPENVKDFGTYTLGVKAKKDNKNVTGETTGEFSIFSEDIRGAQFTNQAYAKAAEEYTGSQIEKDLTKLGTVTLRGKELDAADYRVEFGNNVNAGTGIIYIVGQRTYEGSKEAVRFTINPAKVVSADLSASEYVALNKDAKTAADYAEEINLVVKAHNAAKPAQEFTLVEGEDYTVDYKFTNGNAAYSTIIATVSVNEKSNFKAADYLTKEIKIANKVITDADIKLKQDSYEYTGAVIVPEFDVVVDGKTLVKDKDYRIVSIVDSANVGTATVTVTGITESEYDSRINAKATFEVVPTSAEKLEVKVNGKYVYDGKAQKPTDIVVTLAGNNVKSQFDVAYGENVNAGKDAGTIVLTPKKDNKNFVEGTSKTVTFDIEQATLTGDLHVYDARGIEITKNLPKFEYDGEAKTFDKVVFTPSVKTPVTADDYEIKYVNNVTGGGEKGASIIVVAKGNYCAAGTIFDNAGETPVKVENVVDQKHFAIESKLYFSAKEVTVKDAEYAGPYTVVKPEIVVRDGAKVLVEGKDYKVAIEAVEAGVAPSEKTYTWSVVGMGLYEYKAGKPSINSAFGTWKVVKKDVANLEIKVDLDADGNETLTVMNGNVKVDNKNFVVTLSEDKKTATVAASEGNKYYIGSTEVAVGGEAVVVEAPMIERVDVTGNKATVILSGESDGAVGYDYVISADRDCITNKDYAKVNKNILTTETTFTYTQSGVYYAYCHAWRRDSNGKKVFSDWSNAYPFSVSAITVDQPVITSVKVNGSTVTVTYTKAANAEGYDVVLGSAMATVAGEKRPVEYGTLVKKNINGDTVTATFKNVPAGTYYAGLHAFNRTSEDGKKVFSPWSNCKTVTVK